MESNDPIEAFLTFLNAIFKMKKGASDYLRDHVVVEYQAKGVSLLPVGKVPKDLYFIHEGLVRGHFRNERGKDVTGWFAMESSMIYTPHNFRTQTPARQNVEILEDSTLVSLPYEALDQMYMLHIGTRMIGQILSEQQVTYLAERLWQERAMSAVERYWDFMEKYPGLHERVRANYIASFLDMTPETYSRIQSGSIQRKKSVTTSSPKDKPRR